MSVIARTRFAALILAVMAIVGSLLVAVSERFPAHAADCPDAAILLGAEGSGERGSGPPGLGPEVSFAFSSIKNRLAARGISVTSRAVDYPAAPVIDLVNGNLVSYFNSLETGVQNALAQLHNIQSHLDPSCAGSPIILAGYSQGAMVMHRVLERLSPGGSDANSALLARIGAVLLIADGDKHPSDTAHLYPAGRTAGTTGVGAANTALSHTSVPPLPGVVRDRVFSVCTPFDLVCDFTNRIFNFGGPQLRAAAWAFGGTIHRIAYKSTHFGAIPPLVDKFVAGFRSAPPPSGGQQTTLPFTGLDQPSYLTVDGGGNVLVTDQGANRVLKLANGATTQTTLPLTGLSVPRGVAVNPAGDVIIADSNNSRVLKLANGTTTQTMLPFTGLSANLFGLAVNSAGDVFVTDDSNGRVLKLANGATTQTTLPFTGLSTALGGVAVNSAGDVFLAVDTRVLKLTNGATTQTTLPFTGLGGNYNGVAVNSAGDVFVADGEHRRVLKLANGATTQTELPFTGLGTTLFGLAVNSAGDVFVADLDNKRVLRLSAI